MPIQDWITARDLHDRIIDREQIGREVRAFVSDLLDGLDTVETLGMLAAIRSEVSEAVKSAEGDAISQARAEGLSWIDLAAYLDVSEVTARRTFHSYGEDRPRRDGKPVAKPGHEWIKVPDAVRQGRVDGEELSSLTRTASRKKVTDYVGKRSGHHVRKVGKAWHVELPLVGNDD